jgi:hypothetical protein
MSTSLVAFAFVLLASAVNGAASGFAPAPRHLAVPRTSLSRPRACPLPLKASESDDVAPDAATGTAPHVTTPAAPAPAPPKPAEPICATCDGSGRIEGGWGTLPGLKWVSTTFGLRAFRPCPECARAGRRYVRVGQNLEEIYSGAPRRRDNNP